MLASKTMFEIDAGLLAADVCDGRTGALSEVVEIKRLSLYDETALESAQISDGAKIIKRHKYANKFQKGMKWNNAFCPKTINLKRKRLPVKEAFFLLGFFVNGKPFAC